MKDKTITISVTTFNKKDIQFILTNLELDNCIKEYDYTIITTTTKYLIDATIELKKDYRGVLEKKYKTEINKLSIERLLSLLCSCKRVICNYSIDEIVYTLIRGYNGTKIADLMDILLHKLDLFNNTGFNKYYHKKEQEKEQYKVKEIYKQKSISIKE